MTLLGWLLGLVLPACATTGASGLPVPRPMDMTRIERPVSPNTILAAPVGFTPRPDVATAIYPIPAVRLLAAIGRVAGAEPRTYLAALYEASLQRHWVVRSAVFNFPDLVTAQTMPDGPEASTLLLYSRSVYGYGDFGVNRRRVLRWLAALDDMIKPLTKRPASQ
jgi:uncharacterized protein (DUF1499 family)